MTDEMRAREKAICEAAKVDDIGEVSDGFHTFNSLYEQRMILFAALVKAYKDKSWKSYRHEDGEYCFGGGWFIVGIDTPEGSYTYHYENKYWDMFDCTDLPRAKHWDGHTEADAEARLMSLKPERKQADGDCISRQMAIDALDCINGAEEVLRALASAQPEILACGEGELNVPDTNVGDMISRQAAIETVKKHYRVDNDLLEVIAYEIEALPSAHPATNCSEIPNSSDDTISRQAAIDALVKAIREDPYYDSNEAINGLGVCDVRVILNDLPSEQPERKMGKWIYNSPVTMKCDQCGFVIKDWDWHRFKFCPNCDCDMRGEQE